MADDIRLPFDQAGEKRIKNAYNIIVDVLSDKLCGSKFYVPKPHILYIIQKI